MATAPVTAMMMMIYTQTYIEQLVNCNLNMQVVITYTEVSMISALLQLCYTLCCSYC
jgi:hypothetical protein